MARIVVLVVALLLLVMSNRATPTLLHCRAIGVDVHEEAAGVAMCHGGTLAAECQVIGVDVDVHEEAAGVVMVQGAMPALECRTIGIDVRAEVAGFVMGHAAMPTLECRAIEVQGEAEETSDSELDELKRSGYGDVREKHSSVAENPAQLLLEEEAVKQFAGKKGWTSVVHQLQVPREVSADGRQRIIPEAAEFPCNNQVNISNPSQDQVVDFSCLDQRVRPRVRSSHGTAGNWNNCGVMECPGITARANISESLVIQKASAGAGSHGRSGSLASSSGLSVLQYKKKDNADSLQAFCNKSLASFVASSGDRSAQDTGSVKVFCNQSLDYFIASPDHYTPAQDTGSVKVFCNQSLASFIASPDHDTPAQDTGSVKVFCNQSLASFIASPDHDTPAQDAGSVKVFCNQSLASSIASPDHDTPAQAAGTVKVFLNESLASCVPSPDHDASAHDAGTLKVISAMFSVVLLGISVGIIKWKTPRKVHILFTGLLLASITHYVESVDPPVQPPPLTFPVYFDIKKLEPTFVQERYELVVRPNCLFVGGHYIMPQEEFIRKGPIQPPPRWIRTESVGESGKESAVIMRGDTMYLLAFVDGPGLVHFMGEDNAALFPGGILLPFKENYASLFGVEGEHNVDIAAFLQTIPLGKSHTEAANTILSDYTPATPVKDVRGAILNYIITLAESQRIKSLGDRLRRIWEKNETTYLTRDEALNILVWSRLSIKWCSEDLGDAGNALNEALATRGLYSIDAINNTIDLVKWPRKKSERGRCELPTQE